MAEIVIKTIKFKRGTSAAWARTNPVLLDGEPGYEKDTKKLKIGDGSTAWNDLPYIGENAEIAADGKSIIVTNEKIELQGFSNAQVGQIPRKGTDENLEWVDLNIPEELTYQEVKDIIHNIKEGE